MSGMRYGPVLPDLFSITEWIFLSLLDAFFSFIVFAGSFLTFLRVFWPLLMAIPHECFLYVPVDGFHRASSGPLRAGGRATDCTGCG
jgi:hypothetical protein